MEWNKFKDKFHISWHTSIKKFIESNECNKIYNFLRRSERDIIYPKSINTFRNFENANLKETKAAILFREPYNDMESDGIPLSCILAYKVHPTLNRFHDAMEKEFYDLTLNLLKDHNLDFLLNQDVFLYNVDITVFRNKPESHKDVWKKFTIKVIETLVENNIPIMFIGEDVKNRFIKFIPPAYPEFCVKEAIQDVKLIWNTNGEFLKLNKYIHNKTDFNEIMWVDMDVPF